MVFGPVGRWDEPALGRDEWEADDDDLRTDLSFWGWCDRCDNPANSRLRQNTLPEQGLWVVRRQGFEPRIAICCCR